MTRRPDHAPATLEAHARRLERVACVTPPPLSTELLQTADLLRRLAEDLRLVDRFLRDAALLAPMETSCDPT